MEIEKFDSFNEKKKWIKDAIKNPGALGQPGNTVKVQDDKGKQIGVFKVLDSITGQVLKNIKNVKGNTLYDLYLFDKKL